MWESSDFKILVIQSVIIWATLITAIVMLARFKGDRGEAKRRAAEGRRMAAKRARVAEARPNAPMLTFVTADEIYAMSLEELQSVPQEHLAQLPPDKREIV